MHRVFKGAHNIWSPRAERRNGHIQVPYGSGHTINIKVKGRTLTRTGGDKGLTRDIIEAFRGCSRA